MDSRGVPHTVCIAFGSGRARRHFIIEKTARRIVEADVHQAIAARRRGARIVETPNTELHQSSPL
jgi:hypothetical protein